MGPITDRISAWIDSWINSLLRALGLLDKDGTLLLLGLDNAGKTTLLHRLRTGNVLQFPPTERPHLETFNAAGVKFVGWDLGGHEAVRHLWEDYVPESSAVVFLIDACDAERLEEVRDELDALLEDFLLNNNNNNNNNSSGDDANNNKIPVAVLLNKCDREEALSSQEICKAIGFEELVMRHGEEFMALFRTSVIRGEGYQDAFQWLASFL